LWLSVFKNGNASTVAVVNGVRKVLNVQVHVSQFNVSPTFVTSEGGPHLTMHLVNSNDVRVTATVDCTTVVRERVTTTTISEWIPPHDDARLVEPLDPRAFFAESVSCAVVAVN
jgi:uncharacterized protein (DUF39 family)